MTLREIEESLAENERKLPGYIDVASIEMYVNGCGSKEVDDFFEGNGNVAVAEHIRLLRLKADCEREEPPMTIGEAAFVN